MEVRNCKKCGKIFNSINNLTLCPACQDKQEDIYRQVKEFIYQNPGVGINEVAVEFDITTVLIRRWVREERLSFAENSQIGIECEGCGTMIRTGRFCNTCKFELENQLKGAYQTEKKMQPKKESREEQRMRFLQ